MRHILELRHSYDADALVTQAYSLQFGSFKHEDNAGVVQPAISAKIYMDGYLLKSLKSFTSSLILTLDGHI